MRTYLTLLLVFTLLTSSAQVIIRGHVTDKKDEAIVGANVYIENCYDGTTTGYDGRFALETEVVGSQVLIISCVGFEPFTIRFHTDSVKSHYQVRLSEVAHELDAVVITAGTFEAGDKKQSMVLSAFDVASTASAQGDIYGAFNAVPGTQKVGEEGRLFVRGGDSYETRTFMDGMAVTTPYYTRAGDIPTRGRYSPLLFEGLLFSTGGYSAEYGQALSSVVALQTTGLEKNDKQSLSLMSVGAGYAGVKTWDRASVGITADYINSNMHNRLFKPAMQWNKAPQNIGTTLMFRHQTGESGLIKSFASVNLNQMDMQYHNFPEQKYQHLVMDDGNLYLNTVYNDMIGDSWLIQGGVAYTYDVDHLNLESLPVKTIQQGMHLKLKATCFLNEKLSLKTGTEGAIEYYSQVLGIQPAQLRLEFDNPYLALFSEAEWQVNNGVALRMGGRLEHSFLNGHASLSPRISSAFKTGEDSQVSLAYGTFLQSAQNDYLKVNSLLDAEKASHWIVNYQYRRLNRLMRIEAYRKNYRQLVTYSTAHSLNPLDYGNDGRGYSQGIDVFWRDGSTFKDTDYWISYSYNDSRRLYKDYPEEVRPSYASAHNLSVVYKRFVPAWTTFLSAGYSMASPRPFHNPNKPGFMQDATGFYHDISCSITYLTRLMNNEVVLHLMVNNLLARNNVFGYEYSNRPDTGGAYARKAIVSPVRQQAVLVLVLQL